jgi:Tfp pilus assembly protein PilN
VRIFSQSNFYATIIVSLNKEMAALKKEKQINLLPKDSFSETSIGRIILWFLSTFRIMVIVVELVVVAAFLSRFWLDSKNADLTDEIKQKQAQIKASEATEKLFRELQKRVSAFSILTSQPKLSSSITSISSLMPPTITLNSIGFSEQGITIIGNTPNEQELAQFLVNLKKSEDFTKVSLSQIGPDQDNKDILKFTISLNIKNKTAPEINQ